MTDVEFPASAFWIGSAHPFDLQQVYLCFRKTWPVDRLPSTARLDITADSRYRLWVNGQFVARGPARSYPHYQSVDSLDVAACLRPGLNGLAVQVYQPGYSHFSYVHRGQAGVLAHLVCDGESVCSTDPSWRTRRDPSFSSLVPRVSIYGSGVEERDLNAADDWTAPAYDDSGWAPARVIGPVGEYPWTHLPPRQLPLLEETEIELQLLEMRRGAQAVGLEQDAHLALRQGWGDGAPASIAQLASNFYAPQLAAGESAFWLFSLPRDYACQGWAEIKGASGEERLSVSYAEKMRPGGLVISDPEDYARLRPTDRFHLRPGAQTAESFALRGGRYLLFQLAGPTGAHFRIRFHARAAAYPLAVSRELRLDDPDLARIVAVCEESLRACLLDGFVDGAWRASSQNVGDALPQALVMSAMTDDLRPLRRVIEMAAQGAYPNGILPSVLPSEAHAYAGADYNFAWVELLSHYWAMTCDREFVGGLWSTLKRMLDRFGQDLNPAGLIVRPPGRQLLELVPASGDPVSAVYNLHYLLALQTAGRLAEQIEADNGAGVWQARADELKRAARAAFWCDGRWYDDPAHTAFSQLAGAFAYLTGAALPEEAPALLRAVADRSLDSDDSAHSDKMVLASPFMHHYVFQALRLGGYDRDVVQIIRQRWGRWAATNNPTTWEDWNVDSPDGSQCRARSAHPRYHLAEIARVNPEAVKPYSAK